jgi:hypothetical protein
MEIDRAAEVLPARYFRQPVHRQAAGAEVEEVVAVVTAQVL